MQIVIDIDDKVYGLVKHFDEGIRLIEKENDTVETAIMRAIINGIPLPKGQGRLGDLSKIYTELNEAQIEGTAEYKGLGKAKQIVCDAPTIIEADKEVKE